MQEVLEAYLMIDADSAKQLVTLLREPGVRMSTPLSYLWLYDGSRPDQWHQSTKKEIIALLSAMSELDILIPKLAYQTIGYYLQTMELINSFKSHKFTITVEVPCEIRVKRFTECMTDFLHLHWTQNVRDEAFLRKVPDCDQDKLMRVSAIGSRVISTIGSRVISTLPTGGTENNTMQTLWDLQMIETFAHLSVKRYFIEDLIKRVEWYDHLRITILNREQVDRFLQSKNQSPQPSFDSTVHQIFNSVVVRNSE